MVAARTTLDLSRANVQRAVNALRVAAGQLAQDSSLTPDARDALMRELQGVRMSLGHLADRMPGRP